MSTTHRGIGEMRVVAWVALFALAWGRISVARAGHTSAVSPFRVVLNDAAFRSNETDIMKEFIADHAEFTLADVITTRNRNVTSGFDYLLTNRKGAAAAYGSGSIVSIVPGMHHLTHKALMGRTLSGTPGVAPRSFRIPAEVGQLIDFIKTHPEEGEKVWVMKENKHRGQGVTVVYLNQLMGRMLMLMQQNKGRNPVVLVQEFVEDQLLLNDVPFTFRVWTVFGGGWNTSRAYVFDGSIVPLGDKTFSSINSGDRLKVAQDMIVNLFLQDREKASDPWSINGQFKQHLREQTGSDDAFDRMWDKLKDKTARAFAAALPRLRDDVYRDFPDSYRDNGFEFLGFDFLVDSSYEPHLIEVNHLPSMARKVPGKRTVGSVFDEQKERFIHGLMTVLRGTKERKDFHRSLAERAGCPAGSRAADVMDMVYEGKLALQNGFSIVTNDLYDHLHEYYPSGILYRLQRVLRGVLPEMTGFAGRKSSPRDLPSFDGLVRQTLSAVDSRADERYESVILQTLCKSRVGLSSEL